MNIKSILLLTALAASSNIAFAWELSGTGVIMSVYQPQVGFESDSVGDTVYFDITSQNIIEGYGAYFANFTLTSATLTDTITGATSQIVLSNNTLVQIDAQPESVGSLPPYGYITDVKAASSFTYGPAPYDVYYQNSSVDIQSQSYVPPQLTGLTQISLSGNPDSLMSSTDFNAGTLNFSNTLFEEGTRVPPEFLTDIQIQATITSATYIPTTAPIPPSAILFASVILGFAASRKKATQA